MSFKAIAFVLVGVFVYAGVSHAQMTSPDFQIRWDSISAGGSDTSSSASYQLRDTVDQSAATRSASATYGLDSGYRTGIFDEIITFDMLVQSSGTSRAASDFAGSIISASSVGIFVNDYVVLVQNRGTSQVTGIGKVTAVGAGSITVDYLATAGVDPVIDGTNDYVYRMTGSTIAFGDLDSATVQTSVIAFEVTAENSSGYVVQVIENTDLSDGAEVIADVADGAVTAGSEEYGARSSDSTITTTTFDTQDTAITAAAQSIATSSSASFNQRTFITMKVGISALTEEGNYGHVLTFIASGNF